MRNLLFIALLLLVTVTASGCNSCGRPFSRLFNRGDSCRTCAEPVGCPDGNCHDGGAGTPGLLGSPVLSAPYGAEALPGPSTILPPARVQ